MKKYILLSLSINIILYLFISFVKWDILWIIETPNYRQLDRIFIVVFYILKEVITAFIYDAVLPHINLKP